jgi:hypothetical protein
MKKFYILILLLAFIGLSKSSNSQTVHVDSISASCFIPGDSVLVYYTVSSSFNTGNVFTAQISNMTGSFAAPITIGTISSITSGTITSYIPSNTPLGNGYSIRVVSASPTMVSNDTITNITISFYTTLTISPSNDTTICAGNSIVLDAGSHTSYYWSTGATTESITINTSGTYFVSATSAYSCPGMDTIVITVVPNPTVIITSNGPDTFLSGDSVQLDAGVYSSYIWSTGATTETIEANGTNDLNIVTVTDYNGCTGSASSYDTAILSCTAAFIIIADTIPHHYLITDYSIGVPPIHYLWSWGDNTYDSIPYPTHTYADTGYYNICISITDADTCTNSDCYNGYYVSRNANAMAVITVISPTAGINRIVVNNSISVYPNPANKAITIHSPMLIVNCQLSIVDVIRNKIYQQNISGIDNTIDVSKWSEGVYFYEIKGSNGNAHGKFMIEK